MIHLVYLPSGETNQEWLGNCKAELLNLYLLLIISTPGRRPNCKQEAGAPESHGHITFLVTFSKTQGL